MSAERVRQCERYMSIESIERMRCFAGASSEYARAVDYVVIQQDHCKHFAISNVTNVINDYHFDTK
jgi:hypothetical protein